VRQDPLTNNIN